MTIFTIGFTQKNAEQFFGLINANEIEILLDVRLNNKSQLAGFTKEDDLRYFLAELCRCEYKHCLEFAPTKEILDPYKKKLITWAEYTEQYTSLMQQRGDYLSFVKHFSSYDKLCLLCSEPTPEQCHRRLIAELIAGTVPEQIEIKHI